MPDNHNSSKQTERLYHCMGCQLVGVVYSFWINWGRPEVRFCAELSSSGRADLHSPRKQMGSEVTCYEL